MVQQSPIVINSAYSFNLLKSTGQYCVPRSCELISLLIYTLLSGLPTCLFLTLYLLFMVMGVSSVLEFQLFDFFFLSIFFVIIG